MQQAARSLAKLGLRTAEAECSTSGSSLLQRAAGAWPAVAAQWQQGAQARWYSADSEAKAPEANGNKQKKKDGKGGGAAAGGAPAAGGSGPAAAKAAGSKQPAAKQPAPKQAAPKQQAPKQPAAKQSGPKQPAAKQPAPKQPAPKPAAPKPVATPAPERPSWHSGADAGRALSAPHGLYFDAPLGAVPEAEKRFYADPLLADERVNQPNYGCRGVQAEYAATGHEALLQRDCLARLLSTVAEQRKGHLLLDGWAGAGKSCAMFGLVSWARANGWLTLYVPSAYSLVQGGLYSKAEDGLWDTPWAARYILQSVLASHEGALAALKTAAGEPLADLVARGLGAQEPGETVAAAIQLKDELAGLKGDMPVLLAVDDYNALYSHTGYYESMHSFHRRPIAADELRLARAYRLLEQPRPVHGVTVVAPTFGSTVSEKLALPAPKGSRFAIPRYSLPEVEATSEYYRATHGVAAAQPRSEATLRKALFLTNGNAKELRQYAQVLLNEEDPLGVSLGHKAFASEQRRYDNSWEGFASGDM